MKNKKKGHIPFRHVQGQILPAGKFAIRRRNIPRDRRGCWEFPRSNQSIQTCQSFSCVFGPNLKSTHNFILLKDTSLSGYPTHGCNRRGYPERGEAGLQDCDLQNKSGGLEGYSFHRHHPGMEVFRGTPVTSLTRGIWSRLVNVE